MAGHRAAGGMLGRDTVDELTRRGEQVTGLYRAALDITRAEAVERALSEHRPGIVVNCAAYTAVDDAETDEERATLIDGDGPRLLARACAAHGARLIHVSTDYVFSGDARATPYPEDHPTALAHRLRPLQAGRRARRAGGAARRERRRAHRLAVRSPRHQLRADDDRSARLAVPPSTSSTTSAGSPPGSADVAARMADLGPRVGDDVHGVLHATSSGEATWYDLAREVFRLIGADPDRVRPTTGSGLSPARTAPRVQRPRARPLAGHRPAGTA
ncbi:dTDP-4-dehydrorhamnose reductase [Streptomyces hirsutus]